MSGHTKDFELRVLTRVKNFLLSTLCMWFERLRTQMADILTLLSSAESRNERENSKQ